MFFDTTNSYDFHFNLFTWVQITIYLYVFWHDNTEKRSNFLHE